jgi:5-methylcytosine-specific restriction endonuclease McrA
MSGLKITPADKAFSREIRERDGWTCQRCGKRYVPPTKALHSAHNFTRRTGVVRVDPSNAMALCYGCHQFIDSHAAEKEALFRGKFGDDEYERVASLAHGKRDRV